ncbi:hypothetical protein FV219_00415 [Methylobacterium sp. WL122]|nr:hypothetical protein FV219_00415 [Methylobacterium sp. WL122]
MLSRSLRRADDGLAAIEYAIIAGLIGIGLVGTLVSTKSSLNKAYGCITSAIDTQSAGSGCGGGTTVALPSDPVLAAAQMSLPAGTQVNSVTSSAAGSIYSADVRTGTPPKIYARDQSLGVLYVTTILSSGPNYYEVQGGTDYTGTPIFNASAGQTTYAVRDSTGKYSFFTVTKP